MSFLTARRAAPALGVLLAVLLVVVAPHAVAAQGQARIALVIGNSGYANAPLANPANDARLMSATLRRLGFDVIERIDADQKEMKVAIFELGDRLEQAGKDAVGLFFYAGHGVQVDGENYLIPLKLEISKERHVAIEAVGTSWVLGQMEFAGNRMNFVILDACRNNPLTRSFRSAVRGLARMDAPSGSLVAYSTGPGKVARDGEGANSEFTAALARELTVPGVPVEQVFKRVRRSVMAATNDEQVPWESSSLTGDFYFNGTLNVSVVAGEGDRLETGGHGAGGRGGYAAYFEPEHWQGQADEALRQALVNLEAVPAPAGEMQVVLGPGWPGILLHEAIGHGLEGDFNRKKTSAFAGLMGERVAAPGVTVIDDGTIADRRGSLTVDDEGTPTQRTVLIEDGVLVGYLHDRQNARLMGMAPTGNGRRESYAHSPMPRMTNTFMAAGERDPAEIIAGVDKGLYAVNFGGGQVDITSGKFVFTASEAYLIEGGKVTRPVKGASLIGNGPDVLTRVAAIGNDMALDSGIGTCGKNGQGVPVGVGLPTLLIDGLTVGGTAA